MEIKNYYILLDLSVDPVEEDPQVIEEAIQKKQALWSKQRNHPTKGTQAQQYIGMIPEIRKVMSEPELRQKEAEEARKLLLSRDKEKFIQIDRHLGLLMSKGKVSDKEVDALARFHGATPESVRERLKQKENIFKLSAEIESLLDAGKADEKAARKLSRTYGMEAGKIQRWIAKKKKDKYHEIDYYLNRCGRRGYVTESEISRLSRLYGLPEESIRQRSKCAIRKKGDIEADKASPLDRSIEKIINDNLNIIGKSSLYHYLGVPSTADLPTLQQKTREKDAQNRQISQKNAIATASGTLVGQCMAIFKSEEMRKRYDRTRTLSQLGELNTDIDAAGISGKILAPYYEILVRRGLKLGMDIEEAIQYVENYAGAKKWGVEKRIKKPEAKKKEISPERRRKFLWATAAVVLLVLTVGLVLSARMIQANRLENAYTDALQEADNQSSLEGKEVILKNFVRYNPESEYTEKIEQQIRQIRRQIEERDYRTAMEKGNAAYAEGDLAQALAFYRDFYEKHPKSGYAAEINQKIAEVGHELDDRDYERLAALADDAYDERVQAYNAYFANHPQGRHTEEVRALNSEMVDRYYDILQQDLQGCENREEWDACIATASAFIEKFKDTEQADAAKGLINKYQNRMQIQADLKEMKQRVADRGTDYEGARAIYLDYMEANPEMPSYLKRLVVSEIKTLDQKIEARDREEKTWEEVRVYANRQGPGLGDKIQRVQGFLGRYGNGPYSEEARSVLDQLQREKALEDERLMTEQAVRQWQELVAYVGNNSAGLTDRINRLEQYMNRNPSSPYRGRAQTMLARLNQQKQAEEERLRRQQANQRRIQQETQRLQALLRQSGGRFVDNGNGTVTDTRTGLMWTIFDGAFARNQCLTFQGAASYAGSLTTGGYSDWRLPTVSELQTILKNPPYFPTTGSKWYWSSETYWHGWNKMVNIVTSKQERQLTKDSVSEEQCGTVLAVRR